MLLALNAIIALCCFGISGLEAAQHDWSVATAYFGFGIGYIGLTWLYFGG